MMVETGLGKIAASLLGEQWSHHDLPARVGQIWPRDL
jgi:hypothetical protein